MDKYKLAEWLHNNYEQLAKEKNWQTQEITRVKFDDLPAENKSTMLALADRMLDTFSIISFNPDVIGSAKKCVLGQFLCKCQSRYLKEFNENGCEHYR